MANNISKVQTAAEVSAALIAAAAAGYYFYGSKRAKKHRDVVAKELKSDWKMIQREAKKATRTGIPLAKKVGEQAIREGKKTVKKLVKTATAVQKKSR